MLPTLLTAATILYVGCSLIFAALATYFDFNSRGNWNSTAKAGAVLFVANLLFFSFCTAMLCLHVLHRVLFHTERVLDRLYRSLLVSADNLYKNLCDSLAKTE